MTLRKLNRWARQYSRVLLAVVMALLLVSWLVGDALTTSLRQREQSVKVATAFGESITSEDINLARRDLNVLLALEQVPNFFGPIEYMLLVKEARDMGMRAGRDEAMAALRETGVTDDIMSEVQRRHKVAHSDTYRIVGDWLGVRQAMELQFRALGDSTARMKTNFRRREQIGTIKLSVLDARAFVALAPEPTDEQLAAFFEEGKGRRTQHQADKLQFGYLRPDMVQVEWVTLDPGQVQPLISVREREVKRYFESNAAKYTKVIPGPGISDELGGQRVQQTYDEAASKVRDDYIRDESIRQSQAIINRIRDELASPWLGQPRSAEGFREPPASVASLEELADKYRKETGMPIVHQRSELLERADFQKDVPLSRAFVTFGTQQAPGVDLAFRVPGLYKPQEQDIIPVLAKNEPSPVIVERRQTPPPSAYVFRVIEIAPSAPPASWQDVRAQLVDDWKLSRAFDLAEQEIRSLAEQAREVGLEQAVVNAELVRALLEAADTLQELLPVDDKPNRIKMKALFDVETPSNFTRGTAMFPPDNWRSPKLTEELWAALDAPPTATQPKHRIVVAPVPNGPTPRWAFAEIVDASTLYEKSYDQQRATLAGPSQQEMQFLNQAWLTGVRRRANFQPVAAEGESGPVQ